MADYYTETSISIGDNDTMDGEPATKIDGDWFLEFMEIVNDLDYVYESYSKNIEDWPMDDLKEKYQKLAEEDIIKAVHLASHDHYICNVFKVDVDKEAVYLYNNEDANIDFLEEIVQYTLQKHDSNEIVPISWSAHCSKPRTGEQGGGAMVVTKDTSKHVNTFSWIAENIHNIKMDFKNSHTR